MTDPVPSDADYCAGLIRQHDPDRWLCALFLPDAVRPAVLAVCAFNLELSRARESVSEPMLGQIRLQWWRESIAGIYEGKLREQPVVRALAAAIAAHNLPRGTFDGMIDARERDLAGDPPLNLAVLLSYTENTAAALLQLILSICAGSAVDTARNAARDAGIAFALVGLLRAIPHHLAHGQVFLPADLLGAHGLLADHVRHEQHSSAMRQVVGAIAAEARKHLAVARSQRHLLLKPVRRVLLPATLAALYLDRLEAADFDIESPALSVSPLRKQVSLLKAALLNRY